MGLSFSGARPCCCRNNVLITDDGEVVSLTAHDFDVVDIESEEEGNFYVPPDMRVVTRAPGRQRLRSSDPPSRHTHRRTPGGACPATQFPPPPCPIANKNQNNVLYTVARVSFLKNPQSPGLRGGGTVIVTGSDATHQTYTTVGLNTNGLLKRNQTATNGGRCCTRGPRRARGRTPQRCHRWARRRAGAAGVVSWRTIRRFGRPPPRRKLAPRRNLRTGRAGRRMRSRRGLPHIRESRAGCRVRACGGRLAIRAWSCVRA
uniref:Cytoplasmic envelopment protein 3 n=1 Tax=Human herpesvirus 1 TaxID=10298 RepID=F8RFP0_HHV1|nr:truncated myristylated tegument protein [Human alphaherpesvirus 1]